MTDAAPNQVEAYLAELCVHLEGLPEQEREELLADLAGHLTEVAADTDEPLSSVVGASDAFARELLASAGATTLIAPPRRQMPNPLRAIANTSAWQSVEPTLQLLRPAWWVLRGYVLALAFGAATGNSTRDSFPLPTIFGSSAVGLLGLLAAIAASVALGTHTTPRLRWWLVVPNLALVVVGFSAASWAHSAMNEYPSVSPAPAYAQFDGKPIPSADAVPAQKELIVPSGAGKVVPFVLPAVPPVPWPAPRYGDR